MALLQNPFKYFIEDCWSHVRRKKQWHKNILSKFIGFTETAYIILQYCTYAGMISMC